MSQNSSHLTQNSFIDYVDGKFQPQTELRVAVLFRNVSFFLSLIRALLMVCFIFTEHIPLVANNGAAQGSWSWIFEIMAGSSTFNINLRRALLAHMLSLGHLMLRDKRKSDYLAQVKIAIFILEIKPCNLLPFPAHRSTSKEASTRREKIHRSTGSPF